jgi:hypothetical protein
MSKAILCDKCKDVCSEQSATHIDTKFAFMTTHLDLCPKCAKEFREFVHGKKEDASEEA